MFNLLQLLIKMPAEIKPRRYIDEDELLPGYLRSLFKHWLRFNKVVVLSGLCTFLFFVCNICTHKSLLRTYFNLIVNSKYVVYLQDLSAFFKKLICLQ